MAETTYYTGKYGKLFLAGFIHLEPLCSIIITKQSEEHAPQESNK